MKKIFCLILWFLWLVVSLGGLCAQVSLDSIICPSQFPFTWNGVTFNQDSVAMIQNGAVQMTVRHYPTPIQSLNMTNEICAGETLPVSIGLSPQSELMLIENVSTIGGSQRIFLPDGRYCSPYGYSYRSYANFDQFLPGATMTNVNDILYVRLKIEHSALEDLKISIVCPDGNSSKFLADYNRRTESWGNIPNNYFRVNLGLANRLTDVLSCDSAQNPIGVPWDYIWSNNTNHNYQYAAGAHGYCYESANIQSYQNPYWDYGYYYSGPREHVSVKPSNPGNMTQIYHPYQSFSNLLGCRLNGQWYIEVQDMMSEDNGYLTEWELALDPSLLRTIVPTVVSQQLIGPWVTSLTDSTYTITPPANLAHDTTVTYRFVLQTDVGCEFDTTVALTVHPKYEMVRDTSVCDSDFPITWAGANFNTAASRTLHLVTAHGCDSIVTLNLSVKTSSSSTETVDTCDAFTWQNGITYTSSANETIRLQNADGCDSIVTLHLTVNYSEETEDVVLECDSFTWIDGNTYYESTSDSVYVLSTASGCDSVVRLRLTIFNSAELVDEVFECDSFTWIDGYTYYASTTLPEYVLARHANCDSVVHLHLTLGHTVATDTVAEACGSFTWYEHKNIMNSCDNLTHVFNTMNGCDSTVTLHLTIFPLPEACFNYYSLEDNFEIETMLHFEECSPNMVNYHWDMGNSVVFDVPAFDYAYKGAGTYMVTLRVTDANGCSAERHRVVEIKNPELQIIYVPNSFTPNRDGLNDVLKPIGLHITDYKYQFVIYDRWGEVVFKTTDPEQGWDGTYKGQLVPQNSVMSWTLRCASDMGMVRKKGMVVVVY